MKIILRFIVLAKILLTIFFQYNLSIIKTVKIKYPNLDK